MIIQMREHKAKKDKMTKATTFMEMAQLVEDFYSDKDLLGKAKRLVMYIEHKQKAKKRVETKATLKRIFDKSKRLEDKQ